MANLPAQQAQYVKYAEKDKNGIEIAGLGDVVEMNDDRTEMTIGTNLVVDGSIETEDTATVRNLNVTGTADIGTLEFTSASVDGNFTAGGDVSSSDGSLNDTANVLSGAEEVNNYYAHEGDINFTLESGASGINFTYAHWRVSNGKLNVVLSGYTNNLKTRAQDGLINYVTDAGNNFTLPNWIWNKLIPNIIVNESGIVGMLGSQEKKTIHSDLDFRTQVWVEGSVLRCAIYKLDNNRIGISFSADTTQNVSDNLNYEFRYEFNFNL